MPIAAQAYFEHPRTDAGVGCVVEQHCNGVYVTPREAPYFTSLNAAAPLSLLIGDFTEAALATFLCRCTRVPR